jgi:hypothetical protein
MVCFKGDYVIVDAKRVILDSANVLPFSDRPMAKLSVPPNKELR